LANVFPTIEKPEVRLSYSQILAATAAAVFVLLHVAATLYGTPVDQLLAYLKGRHMNKCSCHIQFNRRDQHVQ
jgi:hypothetical protein